MVNSPSDLPQLASDAIFCNPSDIATWVDSLLSEFNHQPLMSLPSGPESKATAVSGIIAVSRIQHGRSC
ncbi:hypothetical protein ACFX1T_014579 [Malus domestica]